MQPKTKRKTFLESFFSQRVASPQPDSSSPPHETNSTCSTADPTLTAIGDNPQAYSPEQIVEMYAAVLDHLLIPQAVKEQMMATQPLDKKWQMIQMQKHVLTGAGATDGAGGKLKRGGAGDPVLDLLRSLRNTRVPELPTLIKLRSALSTANKDSLRSFLNSSGVEVLVQCIEGRVTKSPVTDFDAALLFELVSCCKVVMNNATGMQGVLCVPHAIEAVCRALLFDWKPLALLVLASTSYFNVSNTLLDL